MILFVLLLLAGTAQAMDRPRPIKPPDEVTVTLVARGQNVAAETVNFGLPLPPGFLYDAGLVRVLTPSSHVFAWEPLGKLFAWAERAACDAPVLRNLGGFLILVAQKTG